MLPPQGSRAVEQHQLHRRGRRRAEGDLAPAAQHDAVAAQQHLAVRPDLHVGAVGRFVDQDVLHAPALDARVQARGGLLAHHDIAGRIAAERERGFLPREFHGALADLEGEPYLHLGAGGEPRDLGRVLGVPPHQLEHAHRVVLALDLDRVQVAQARALRGGQGVHGRAAGQNLARLGERGEARRGVDAVSPEIALVLEHEAEMKADADGELHPGARRHCDHALLHFPRRVAGGFPVAEHHHDLVAYRLDDLALVLRDDSAELVQAGLDRFRRGLVAEQLVERRAAAHVGKKNRAFLGNQRHRNRLSFSGTHSNAWACCILVKYPLFSPGLPRPPAESSMTANIKVAERKCYINGQFVGSGRQFAKINPVDGTVVAQVHEADRAMVDAAVRAARAALKGPWGRMALQPRVDLLRKVAEGIEKRFDDFLQAEVADTGKPVSLASHLDIPRGAANFRVFADIVRTYGTESYHLDTPDGKGAVNYAMRKPLGVVGVIAPWNLPLLLLTWKLAPALACGNTIVAKPSEETPSTATLLAEVMHEAGVPAGVYNVVHGFGPDSAGEFITTHPEVNGITFTGETATDAAVAGMSNAIFSNTGQVCLAPERVYVERPIFDRFVAALKARAEALVLGFPQDKATNMGPLISKQQGKGALILR